MKIASFASSEFLRGGVSKVACVLGVALAALLFCLPIFPQAAVGTILGAVVDSSGGAIAGAKVTITDVARGTTRELTTDASGQYTAPSLLSGTYTVRGEAPGFQALEQQNVLLEVAQDVRVDLKLTPGATTQTVTVTGEAPAIDTVNATLGGTITNTEVTELPLVTRNFLDLLQLRPGVVYVPGTPTSTTTNGRREGADVILIEGVTQFDLATSNVLINGAQKGSANDELPLDSVQEFNTEQNPQAEYGWRDGSAVNLGVKSGTNSIHGSAYAFGRDAAATDARTFSASGVEQAPNATVEQPGFTLGGPVIKDKLFWFVSAEFIRENQFSPLPVTVPADLTMVGSGTTANGSGCVSTQFKTTTLGNCGLSMIDACHDILLQPGKSISPLSASISGLNPATCAVTPASGTVENLWPFNPTNSSSIFPDAVTTAPSNNGLAKVDYSPNSKHHFDAFVYESRETTSSGSNYQSYWSTLGIGSTAEYAGAWTYTPNSNWVNDLRGGAAPNFGNSVAGDVSVNPATAYSGVGSGYGVSTGANGFGFMCVTVTGVFPSSMNGLGNCGKNGIRGPQYQLDFTDKVSYLRGNHSFKFGYEQVFVNFNDSSTATLNGSSSFSNLEAFLEGAPTSGSIITGDNTDHYREQWHAAFLQDTWRVKPRVTLTPGIRWEYIGSPHSITNKMGTFDPNQPGGAVQVGPGLPNSTVIHPQATNFNPRMGVAWDIFGDGKTVLRSGIGNLSSFPAILTATGAQVPYGDTLCNSPNNAGLNGQVICPAASVVINRYGTANNAITPNTFSVTPSWTSCSIVPVPASCTTGATTVFPSSTVETAASGPTCGTSLKSGATFITQCSMLVTNPNLKNPKSLQWNLDLQRAITNTLTLDVAYVGVHGYDEIHTVDLNEPALGAGWDATALLNATCIGAAGNAVIGPSTLTGCKSDTTAQAAARPFAGSFPYFEYIDQTQNGFKSNYNGLQVTLNGRNYHGLNFLASYTFAHALDDWTKSSQATSAQANPANPQYQYGNSDLDVRNRLRFSPTYTIPGIKTPGQMLEGWQISGIWAWQTGFAWAPNDATTDDWGGTGENSDRTIPSPNSGVWQSWNFSGPKSAFTNDGDTPVPCYGQAGGCTPFSQAPMAIWQTCSAAAVAPYGTTTVNIGGTTVAQSELALAALTSANGACYIQRGGIITPPAYGTLGNASRGLFHGPHYQDVDLALIKNWKFKERYSAQFRLEVYNIFNHTNFAQFGDGGSDPSGGISSATAPFGYATTGQNIDEISPNRQFQFGLKFMF